MTKNETDQEPKIHKVSADDKNIAVLTHLLSIMFGFIPGLIIWIIFKDKNEYATGQGRESLNFQLTMIILYFIAGITSWVLIGLVLFPMLMLLNLILCISAAIHCSNGEFYRYPISLRLLS